MLESKIYNVSFILLLILLASCHAQNQTSSFKDDIVEADKTSIEQTSKVGNKNKANIYESNDVVRSAFLDRKGNL